LCALVGVRRLVREQDRFHVRKQLRPPVSQLGFFSIGRRQSCSIGSFRGDASESAVVALGVNDGVVSDPCHLCPAGFSDWSWWSSFHRNLPDFSLGAECQPLTIWRKDGRSK